jgi:hypothetical protein
MPRRDLPFPPFHQVITPPAYFSDPGYVPFPTWVEAQPNPLTHVSCDVLGGRMFLYDEMWEGIGGKGFDVHGEFERPISADLYFLYYPFRTDFARLEIEAIVHPNGYWAIGSEDNWHVSSSAQARATLECSVWQRHWQGEPGESTVSAVLSTGEWVTCELLDAYIENGARHGYLTDPVTLHNHILAYGREPVLIHVGASVLAAAKSYNSWAWVYFEDFGADHTSELGIDVPSIFINGTSVTIS